MASICIDPLSWPIRDVLKILLLDRTTKRNIIFATDSYALRGEEYGAERPITEQILMDAGKCIIQPRVLKNTDEQLIRTRKKAEVFTPAWVCCLMNNHIDEVWFGRPSVFGKLAEQNWAPTEKPIQLPKRRRWQTYIDSRRLEITCGEAPYLVSRYDMVTGEIIPIKDRIGILDRKLRIVSENTVTEEDWLKWVLRAFQAIYGYEYQGDNLLIARINLLLTYIDYMQERLDRNPTKKELEKVAKVISWNLLQMDGLKGSIPLGALYEQYHQMTIFDIFGMDDIAEKDESEEYVPCRIYDWRGQNKSLEFNAFRERRNGSMKFDFIIGNPPYQEEVGDGGNKTYATPIYNKFIEGAYEISDKVELIHPARFLFNAGSTPKQWNRDMLSDPHLSVVFYEANSNRVFSNTEIKGGVAVTYHDKTRDFGAIGTFTPYPELNGILRKVRPVMEGKAISNIVVNSYSYHFTEALHRDHPEIEGALSIGHAYDLKSNVMEKIPQVFYKDKPDDGQDYIQIYGRVQNARVLMFIRSDYINDVVNLRKYKVFLPAASGNGGLGEEIASPMVMGPGIGSTETFCSIGAFDTEKEAQNALKYIKGKFARALLSVLKVTQHITPDKFTYVPLQDFSDASDIDWSQSVAGIDRQLYTKYGLSDEEISFIEKHVKEMA